jgi:2-polyprenyl-3-methyl-5-hydroxy-6-metoxy-1,4-benzoquinol methylase
MTTPVKLQRPENDVEIWDKWNSTYRQAEIDHPSKVRIRAVDALLTRLGIHGATILEAGCGTGWLSNKLSEFGQVTACDLGSKILEVAQKTFPQVHFISGDVQAIDLPLSHFDLVVSSEVLAHVPDQPAFIHRLADLLKPGGLVLITTQNKYVFDRIANIPPPEGWIRTWVTMKMLKSMLRKEFTIKYATTLEPEGHLGFMRVVNSKKVNRALNALFGIERTQRLKERAGFGQSLFVIAKKR